MRCKESLQLHLQVSYLAKIHHCELLTEETIGLAEFH